MKWDVTELENFDICFCILLEYYCQGVTSGREAEHYAMASPNFEIFLTFLKFLRS